MSVRSFEGYADCEYGLRFGDRLGWRLAASAGAAQWLERLAGLMALSPHAGGSEPIFRFFRGSVGRADMRRGCAPIDTGMKERLEEEGWDARNLGVLRVWTHPETKDSYCELLNAADPEIESLMMWQSQHLLYERVIQMGGAPLHAALVETNGMGALLVGTGGAGKSTGCRRLPESWRVLCDDECLVIRQSPHSYMVHPLPTWKDARRASDLSWDVQRGVTLNAIFFLEKSSYDEAPRMGAGSAAVRLAGSAHEAGFRQLEFVDDAFRRAWRENTFQNICDITTTIPAFLLRVSPDGRFWERMEERVDHEPALLSKKLHETQPRV